MSPRSKQQNEAIRSKSRGRILGAAFELIAKNGYEFTSIAQIARKADISKGLIYNYFNSKEDILRALVISAFEQGDQMIEQMMRSGEEKNTLRYIIKWFFEELRNRSGLWKLVTELAFKIDKYPFIHELLMQKYAEYNAFLGDIFRKMAVGDAEYEARMLTAIMDGIGFHYLISGPEYPLDEMEKYLIKKYCGNKNAGTHEK